MIMDLYFPKSNFFRVWEIVLGKLLKYLIVK